MTETMTKGKGSSGRPQQSAKAIASCYPISAHVPVVTSTLLVQSNGSFLFKWLGLLILFFGTRKTHMGRY
jgi:hypothetical protein